MVERRNGRQYECVLVDLNTQNDFCDNAGALPVANVDTLIPALRRVVAWAKRNCVPVISSIESHRKCELSDSGHPICCIDGSGGQRKIGFTMFPKRLSIEIDNTLALPVNVFQRYQQVIFRKRTDDLLANPKADRLLTHLQVQELFILGNGLESSVRALVLALRAREKHVSIILEACGYWHKATAELAVRQMEAKGATIISIDDLVRRKLDRRLRARYRISLNGPEATNETIANGRNRNGRSRNGRNGNYRSTRHPRSDAGSVDGNGQAI